MCEIYEGVHFCCSPRKTTRAAFLSAFADCLLFCSRLNFKVRTPMYGVKFAMLLCPTDPRPFLEDDSYVFFPLNFCPSFNGLLKPKLTRSILS